jgi:hypothetical protein
VRVLVLVVLDTVDADVDVNVVLNDAVVVLVFDDAVC